MGNYAGLYNDIHEAPPYAWAIRATAKWRARRNNKKPMRKKAGPSATVIKLEKIRVENGLSKRCFAINILHIKYITYQKLTTQENKPNKTTEAKLQEALWKLTNYQFCAAQPKEAVVSLLFAGANYLIFCK